MRFFGVLLSALISVVFFELSIAGSLLAEEYSLETPVKHFENVIGSRSNGSSYTVQIPNRGVIDPKDVAVIINTRDPYSVEVGEYYASVYSIPAENIVRFRTPDLMQFNTSFKFFLPYLKEIRSKIPAHTQAVVLSFKYPMKILCDPDAGFATDFGMTPAAAIGFNLEGCMTSLATPYPEGGYSPNVLELTPKPFDDFKYRPGMNLLGDTAAGAKAIIARARASQGTFPTGDVYLPSNDSLANETANYWNHEGGLKTIVWDATNMPTISQRSNILFYRHVGFQVLGNNSFIPGAVAYNVQRDPDDAHKWLTAGAAATVNSVVQYGASQNGNLGIDLHAPIFLRSYFSGATTLQAIYGSVYYYYLDNTVIGGDPLARPFGPPQLSMSGGNLKVTTTALMPGRRYQVLAGANESSLTPQGAEFTVPSQKLFEVNISGANAGFYRITDLGPTTPAYLTITPKDIGPWFSNRGHKQVAAYVNKKDDIAYTKWSVDGRLLGRYPNLLDDAKGVYFWTSFDTTAFADGPHVLKFRAINKSGDVNTLTQDIMIMNKEDLSAPSVVMETPAPESIIDDETVFKGTVQDDTFVAVIGASLGSNGAPYIKPLIINLPLGRNFEFKLKDLYNPEYQNILQLGERYGLEINGMDTGGKRIDFQLPFRYKLASPPPKQTPGGPNNNPQNPLPPGKKVVVSVPVSNPIKTKALPVEITLVPSDVVSVEIFIDGKLVSSTKKVKKSPLKKTLKVNNLTKGKHTLKVVVRHKNGKKTSVTKKFIIA